VIFTGIRHKMAESRPIGRKLAIVVEILPFWEDPDHNDWIRQDPNQTSRGSSQNGRIRPRSRSDGLESSLNLTQYCRNPVMVAGHRRIPA
jgi:hypothetical protein